MSPGTRVQLVVCGELTALVDGTRRSGVDLGSRKARTLLELLAVERRHLVSSERIAEVLWPDETPADPRPAVATLVSRLRATVGTEVIGGARGAYGLLAGGPWTCDLDDAAALVAAARDHEVSGQAGLALAAGQRALALLGSHEGLDDAPPEDWLLPLRDQVRRVRRSARAVTAAGAHALGDLALTSELAGEAVRADPLDEAAVRLLMSAQVAAGERAGALATYAALQRALRHELGVDPQDDTRRLHVAILRGEAADRPASRDPRPAHRDDLLGRTAEVAAARGAWARAAAGVPGLLLVTGVAGAGKSRLLGTLVDEAEAAGGRVLAARCHASERSLFLQPVVDALRPALGSLASTSLTDAVGPHTEAVVALFPELADLLPPTPVRRRRPESERRASYAAVTHLLTRLARAQPVLVALDDLQDAGRATTDLLAHLARHLGPARGLRAAASREAPHVDVAATQVSVGPLPASAVHAMAAAAGQAAYADTLVAATRGHAFSVVEMLRALAAGETGVPATLSGAVLARVARTGADGADAVRAAAVLGTRVDPLLLAGMLGVPEVEAVRRCESLVAAALLAQVDAGYEFANDLVQQVVYDDLPAALRRAYHRRAADLLTEQPEALGPHAEAVEDWARAARAWLLVGRRSARGPNARDAVDLLDRGLAAADHVDDLAMRGRLLLARADAFESLKRYTDALDDIDAAVSMGVESGDPRLELAALRKRGDDVPVALHHPPATLGRFLEDGLRLAGALGDRAAQADLGARIAVLATSRLDFVTALAYADRAVAAGRASGDETAVAAGLDGLKTALAYLGDPVPLGAVLAELLPVVRRRADRWVLQWCQFESSFLPAAAGDWPAARRRVGEAIATNDEFRVPVSAPFYRAYRGWFARLAGDRDAALADGAAAVAAAAEHDHPWWFAAACGLFATTLLENGRRDEAADVARRGWESVQEHGSEAWTLLSLAPLAAATGDSTLVAEAESRLAAIRAPVGGAWVLGADAYTCLAMARHERGGEPAPLLAPLLAATGPDRWAAVHDRARVLLSARSVR